MTNCVIGLFHDPQSALVAAGELKSAGFETPELMSPVPIEGVEEVLGKKKDVIRRFTFFGGIFGALFGFTLAAGTAVLYLHPTGGRPIIPIPPFLIITYEMTILLGILATVIGQRGFLTPWTAAWPPQLFRKNKIMFFYWYIRAAAAAAGIMINGTLSTFFF